MGDQSGVRVLFLVLYIAVLAGCGGTTEPQSERAPITDVSYLTADVWNDGQAEVAFYQVERTRDQYGRSNQQRFVVGTYLVKHRFRPTAMTKATDGTGTPAFKYAFFYELDSGSYQYKRNWVVNARQNDLRPFKHSFTSFDWCSNQYREMAFPPDGRVEVRMRSDDYGNRRTSFSSRPQSYPPAELPLLIRGLDFGRSDTLRFHVTVADSAEHVPAKAVRLGRDSLDIAAGTVPAERIAVSYESPVPSLIGEVTDSVETYWRGIGAQRRLLRVNAESGRYQMELVEHVRSPYWKENIWTRLARVSERP
ncbi:hypothetical protein [Salinibacter sp. 10B]|uniref:hypothetical protein n=1 Tax=Salinibacter sp. 10B TaxID=1923971 RepID=UPI0021587EF8|nr:hypothetical protein [Salinibacter sp. 10B]